MVGLFGGNVAFQFHFQTIIFQFLDSSLPFREAYSPSIQSFAYIYLLPILMGYLTGGMFEVKNKQLFYINLGLVAGFVNFSPFLFRTIGEDSGWFLHLALVYYFMIFPILFCIGSMPFYIDSILKEQNKEKKASSLTIFDYLLAMLLGSLVFFLNLIPQMLSKYFIGADVYYHAALTQRIVSNPSIFQNPFFLEGKNFYYSIGYYLLAYLYKFSHLSMITIWMVVVPLFSFVFLFFFYLLSKSITKSFFASTLATIFVLPYGQILWYDPSLRVMSYAFLLFFLFLFNLFLQTGNIFLLFTSFVLYSLAALSHPEIAIHASIILFVYMLLKKVTLVRKIGIHFVHIISQANYSYLSIFRGGGLESEEIFVVFISLYFIILATKYSFFLHHFPISKLMTFNEIPLSAMQPFGVISFIVFLFAPVGIIKLFSKMNSSNALLLSIFSLFSSVIFYFTHIWSLYHRYFTETAYIALAIIAAFSIDFIFLNISKKIKLVLFFITIAYLSLSLIPKYMFASNYSLSTNDTVENFQEGLTMVKEHTSEKGVVLLNANSMMNRYIPAYSGRYIFAGSDAIDKEHQWQVLSFCNGPFAKACEARLKLSDDFFAHPTIQKILTIKQAYHLDYLLLTNEEKEKDIFKNSDIHLDNLLLAQSPHYLLYDLRRIKE